MLKIFPRAVLKLIGWKLDHFVPERSKYLIIGAPHTSNWDFPLTLLAMWGLGIDFSWVAKHTLFKGPFNSIMRRLGGIPVNREKRSGFLGSMVSLFENDSSLKLAIAPEGTRSKEEFWRGGFYQIAASAGVEICLGYVDYESKTIGLGPLLKPSGDVVGDFHTISLFYADKRGRYPEKESTIKLREKEIRYLQKQLSKQKN